MSYKGTVRGGVVVLDPSAEPLPEGAIVEVFVQQLNGLPEKSAEDHRTWSEIMKDFIGMSKTLPEDASYQHDHYLYGRPKKP